MARCHRYDGFRKGEGFRALLYFIAYVFGVLYGIDTSPIVASILAAIHMVYIIPILTGRAVHESVSGDGIVGTYSIESTGIRFNCNVSTAVRLAVYGMFAVLLVSAIVEICIVSIGLKGGPLEEYKRAPIVPLLYAEVFLWVLALAWTVYGTYMVVSPVVAAQCWDNNPCNLSRYLDRADQVLDGSVDDAGFNLDLLIEGGTLAAVRAYNQQLRSLGYLTRNIELAFLNLSGLPYDLERVAQGAPWAGCQNESCAWLISASDACEQWDLLLALPVPRDNKRYFMILVWTGWGLLAFKVFLVALAFNSFPDYEDVESWEGGLRVFSRLCCFGNVLHEEVMEERHVPSRVIAQSLSMLFGSIDLDPTDRLFAALLLAEQQRDQRQINMRLMLDRAGFKMRQAKGGAFFKGRRAWNSGELDPEESHGVRGQGMHAFQPWLGAVEEGRYPVYCRTGLHYDDAGLGEENGGWEASPGGLNASRPPWTPCLRVTHRYMPMLTPAEVPAEYLSHINPVEVAAVCSGPQRPVMASALQDMHRMATFAVAAYGVQNQAWNGGRPMDLLYVSLSLADLVTDLLSQPVDVSDWLPAWVRKEIAEDQPVYAHAGIVSAATAVLVDMEEKDIRCWAFCPPGGLMSWNLAQLTRRFCTSIVVGKDVISRMSFNALKRTVDEMVICLARYCKTSYFHDLEQPELYPPGDLAFLRPFKQRHMKESFWDAVWISANGAYSIESTGIQNNCSVGTAVRVAVYGMFAVMVVAACLEFAIVSIGLNGGPLEESKRAPIKPLLYIEFFLWIVLLSWTGNLTLLQEIEAEGDGDDSTQVVTDIDFTATGGSRAAVALYNEQVKGVGALTRNFEAAFLNATGVPFNPDAAGESAPWFPCQNSTCQKLIQNADECTEWDILLRLPDPSNRKAFFEGLVILVVVAFNSFPDYTEVDSWEGSLRHMSRFCCCGSIMQEAVLDTSEPASREIAKSLNMLFGGIDLDPTDRLFAALLVAEHQSDLRQRSVRHMLSRAGAREEVLGVLMCAALGGTSRYIRVWWPFKRAMVAAPPLNLSLLHAGFITNMQKRGTFITGPQRRDGGQLEHFPEPRPKQSVSWHLPPSPFSTKAADIRPMYRRTTLKLDEGALEEGGHLDKAASGTDSPSLEWVREQLGTRLTMAYRYTPIVTPVCLPAVYCDHLTPQEAADIYSGPREGVPTHQLRQAQSMSLYAIAAYGLQNIAWGRGKRPPTCAANVNLFRKCMSKVFRLQNSYRQQNCEAILEVTDANTSGGALPYLVMRHRPSNSLVISIRGTVSMEDLITDLLSQPVDVSDWLPPWVQEVRLTGF
ncbi:hypothetical protein F751_0863 [Auxenochlorella protothecoides]|uniref:Uncharacterized protein n=1 Tax=Auxenochlorella protothecoides TaxID=3075 RepID=A0A087SHX1_AUXPR|nr:hypothetical protein F751_0863 [Auxenochlorella protothecoides]KFM25325.1 hypothetical protein F751_0863 [Auxenochlorella protothecoides]